MSILAEGHCIGPYQIIRLLGTGGMGAVYEARQEPLNRRVAIKTLHTEHANNQEAIARFFSEAKVLSFLEHPSLVQVSDFGYASDGTAYLVMEYLRGQSLSQLLATGNGRLSLLVALRLAWQIADVLTVAHAHGIVHRDLKPENLMLVADPVALCGERVKILDFGIAKLTRGSELGNVKTDTQAVMGTPMYMSPEQCAGAGAVDEKTDVYSLGCVLYQALAGRPPFLAEGTGALIGMHLFQLPSSLALLAPSLPNSVTALVDQMLRKAKGQRPSMAETADRLERLLTELAKPEQKTRSRRSVRAEREAKSMPDVPWQALSSEQRSIGKTRQQRVLLGSAAGLTMAAATMTAWMMSASLHTAIPSRISAAAAAAEHPLNVATGVLPPPASPAHPPEVTPWIEEPAVAVRQDAPIHPIDKPPSAGDSRAPKLILRPAPPPYKDADISAFFPKK